MLKKVAIKTAIIKAAISPVRVLKPIHVIKSLTTSLIMMFAIVITTETSVERASPPKY